MIQLVKMWLGFDNKSKQFYKMKQNTMMIWEPLCKRGLTAQIAIAQHAIGQQFFEKVNCSTQKMKLLESDNRFFEQFLFSERNE